MNAATERLLLAGPAGKIDVALDRPAGAPVGVALVAHPHPLHGGTRDNKVVQTLARALVQLGFVCWRPNFRGVEGSEGSHDEGIGETDDMLALLEHARAHDSLQGLAQAPVALAGFSFGCFVQTRVAARLLARGEAQPRMALVGPAASRFALEPVPADTLVVHGEVDDVVPLGAVLDWARPQDLPVVVVPGADHFFHRRLPLLKRLVLRWMADAASGPAKPSDYNPD
jgi:alpha/beta superfamily hydrolase